MPENTPGIGTALLAEEKHIWVMGRGQEAGLFDMKVDIAAAVVDSGNTNFTTTLRAGLIMAIKDSDGLAYAYDADAVDGTQNPVGILPKYVNMLVNGTATQRVARLFTQGLFRDDELIGIDARARALLWQMGAKTIASGQYVGIPPAGWNTIKPTKYPTVASGTVTLTAADSGKTLIFNEAVATGSGIVLPTIAVGLQYDIVGQGDFDRVITAGANTINVGDAGGGPSTTLTYSTANKKPMRVRLTAEYMTPGTPALFWNAEYLYGTVVST